MIRRSLGNRLQQTWEWKYRYLHLTSAACGNVQTHHCWHQYQACCWYIDTPFWEDSCAPPLASAPSASPLLLPRLSLT